MDTQSVKIGGRSSGKFNEMVIFLGKKLMEERLNTFVILGMTEEQSVTFSQQIRQEFDFYPHSEPVFENAQEHLMLGIFPVIISTPRQYGYKFSYLNLATNVSPDPEKCRARSSMV